MEGFSSPLVCMSSSYSYKDLLQIKIQTRKLLSVLFNSLPDWPDLL